MTTGKLNPLGLGASLLYFGASALLMRGAVYGLLPWLLGRGWVPLWAFIFSYSLPLATFIGAAFYLTYREGRLSHWPTRLRLRPLSGRQFASCLLLFGLSFLATGLLTPTARYLASLSWLAPPGFLPDLLNPLKTVPGGRLTSFLGVPLKGSYWVVGVYFIFLTFFNILGEELWFRGYLLPRQELSWGRRAWVGHGLLWGLFHVPIYPWTLLYLLPTTLAVSYAAQRFQSTWAGFVIHYAGNGLLALLPLVLGVAG